MNSKKIFSYYAKKPNSVSLPFHRFGIKTGDPKRICEYLKPTPAMKNLFEHPGRKLFCSSLLAGFMTMAAAIGSMVEPGLTVQRAIKNDLTLISLPVRYDDPAILNVTEIRDVNMIGCWPRVAGDSDMDTGAGDYVPIRCSTNIYLDGNRVVLKIFYRIEEYGGDRTIYSGARTTVLFENTKPGYAIRTVGLQGPRLNSFIIYSDGTNRNFRDFATENSYWEYLQYRIDGPAGDDDTVGIRGRLKFTVILENNRLAASGSVREI